MKILTLCCKAITPIFMTGADNRTPELRPSEFKGMMRFWWRAIKAEDNIEKLRKEEAQIFGGTGKGEGKSKIQIRILNQVSLNDIFDYQPLPHHERNNCELCGERCKKSFTQKTIKPQTEFNIEFTFMENFPFENLIYIMFTIGGFGKRSRRGFGSFKIVKPSIDIKLEEILKLLNSINNIYAISNSSEFLKKDVKTIKNINRTGGKYPWIREIILSEKSFDDYNEFLKEVGLLSHKFKNPSLGSSNPRMSSPIYVSAVEINKKLYSIVTILNFYFPSNYNYPAIKQKEFIKALIMKESEDEQSELH